jgi:biopolymer transport protein TolR
MGANLGSSGSSRNNRKNRLNPEINITPFVDVMLVLLVIFMVTAPMLVSGINIDLPKTTASPMTGQDEPLTIDVDTKGDMYLQEIRIKPEELVPKLKSISKEKKDTRIFIRGDARADYGKIAQVLDLIQAAGYNKVALLTGTKEEKSKRK